MAQNLIEKNLAILCFGIFYLAPLTYASGSGVAPVFPTQNWQSKKPEELKLDPVKLQAAIDYLKSKMDITNAIIIRSGYVVWQGSKSNATQPIWSANKAYTSTVMGLLYDSKTVGIDTKASDIIKALKTNYPSVTLRHFLTMTSGYREGKTDLDPAKPKRKPGTAFEYYDPAMHEFGNILTQAAKKSMKDVFVSGIAKPVGMKNFDWKVYAKVNGLDVNGGAGRPSSGIITSSSDIARLCYLFLRGGNWNGKQLISREWVDLATETQVPASFPGEEGPGNYGFNWWTNGVLKSGQRPIPAPPETFAARGFNTNACFGIPEWDMVFARLGTDGTNWEAINGFFSRLKDAIK